MKKKILKFYSDDCPPCQWLTEPLQEFSKKEDIPIISIDVTKDEESVKQYQITSVPTIIFLEDDQEINRYSDFLEIIKVIKA